MNSLSGRNQCLGKTKVPGMDIVTMKVTTYHVHDVTKSDGMYYRAVNKVDVMTIRSYLDCYLLYNIIIA